MCARRVAVPPVRQSDSVSSTTTDDDTVPVSSHVPPAHVRTSSISADRRFQTTLQRPDECRTFDPTPPPEITVAVKLKFPGLSIRQQSVSESRQMRFRTDSTDCPDCLPILLSISAFYVLVFVFFHFFSVWFRAVD